MGKINVLYKASLGVIAGSLMLLSNMVTIGLIYPSLGVAYYASIFLGGMVVALIASFLVNAKYDDKRAPSLLVGLVGGFLLIGYNLWVAGQGTSTIAQVGPDYGSVIFGSVMTGVLVFGLSAFAASMITKRWG